MPFTLRRPSASANLTDALPASLVSQVKKTLDYHMQAGDAPGEGLTFWNEAATNDLRRYGAESGILTDEIKTDTRQATNALMGLDADAQGSIEQPAKDIDQDEFFISLGNAANPT